MLDGVPGEMLVEALVHMEGPHKAGEAHYIDYEQAVLLRLSALLWHG